MDHFPVLGTVTHIQFDPPIKCINLPLMFRDNSDEGPFCDRVEDEAGESCATLGCHHDCRYCGFQNLYNIIDRDRILQTDMARPPVPLSPRLTT